MIRLLLFLLLTGLVLADEFKPSPLYEEADKLLSEARYVKAREIGERILKASPDSFEGQCILGRVHLWGEGNPGKADYYLRKARKTILKDFEEPSTTAGPWRCYGDTLWSLRSAAMDLEQYEQAMDWIDEYNERFPPGVPEFYGWPLMKLGRMDDARQRMEKAREDSKEPEAINRVLNTMGAIEYEAANYQESLEIFKEIIARVQRKEGETDPVYYSNAAEASRALLDFPAAEKYLLESTNHLSSNTYSSPWVDLATLYLAQGRQPEAIQALRHHNRHLSGCEPFIQYQKRAISQQMLGVTLMACGYDLEAADILKEVALHGDRNSAISTQRELVRSRNHFFYREALKQKRERLREQRSFAPFKEKFGLYWEELSLDSELEAVRRECAALALKAGGPANMIVPYGPNSFNCPWLTPGLWEVFGAGVVAAQTSAILEDTPEESRPYIQAIYAEARGDTALMAVALEELPPSQKLLRARLQAQMGSPESLQQALESDPPVIRRLSLSLPVQVQGDGGIARMVLASPRFHRGQGFVLSVQGSGSGSNYEGSLQGPDGSVLSRFSVQAETPEEGRRGFCRELHQVVFAPRVNLSQTDINGLDGSNLAGGHFRMQLKELVGASEDSQEPKKP